MRKFKSPPHAQRFLSVFGVIRNLFKVGLSKLNAQNRRIRLQDRLHSWQQMTLNLTKYKIRKWLLECHRNLVDRTNSSKKCYVIGVRTNTILNNFNKNS